MQVFVLRDGACCSTEEALTSIVLCLLLFFSEQEDAGLKVIDSRGKCREFSKKDECLRLWMDWHHYHLNSFLLQAKAISFSCVLPAMKVKMRCSAPAVLPPRNYRYTKTRQQ